MGEVWIGLFILLVNVVDYSYWHYQPKIKSLTSLAQSIKNLELQSLFQNLDLEVTETCWGSKQDCFPILPLIKCVIQL
jgi:hypothetical protein